MKNVHLKDMRNGPEPQRGDAGKPRAQALGARPIAGEPWRGETAQIGNEPCAALSGLPAMVTLNPGLAPWAFLRRPFGACFDARYELWRPHRGTPAKAGIFTKDTKIPKNLAEKPRFPAVCRFIIE